MRPRERQRVRQLALALDGAIVDDTSVVPLTRLTECLHGVGTSLTTAPSDTFKLALRNRLLAVGAVSAPTGGLSSPAPWRRRLVAASAVLAISTGSGASLAIASSDALPGDRLYEVKLAIENVRLALAPNDVAKAERYLAIASTRLHEINAMLAGNPNASADPALIQELREAMAAMAEAVAAGSALFFEIYERTGDTAMLATLEQFLAERSLGLSAVRDLMPTELLLNQASLMVELEGLAAKVAYVTGLATDLVHTAVVQDQQRAGRNAERPLLTASDSVGAVAAALEAMRAAAEAAQRQSAEAAAKSAPAEQTQQRTAPERVQRDVSKYVEVNVTGQDGAVDDVAVSTMPNTEQAREINTGWLKGSWARNTGATDRLLGQLPVPTNDIGASVPGSMSASFSPSGARYAHVAGE